MKKSFLEFLQSKEISQEKFDGMTAENKAELYNEYNAELKAYIETLEKNVNDKASKEEIQAAKDELREERAKQMETLNKALSEMGLAIKASNEKASKGKEAKKTIKERLNEFGDKLKALVNGNKSEAQNGQFAFKVAADMLISTNVSGGNIPVEDRLPGVNMLPSRRVRLIDLISRGRTSSNVVSWVYQANQDGSVDYTAEGSAKNQIDFDLVVANESVQKITAYIKVSTEMLNDIEFIESMIRTELLKELLKKVESEVYSGAGGGSALNGIVTQATAFAAGTFANAIDNANLVDVLTVASNQITLAEHDGPTAVLLHPSDVATLKMTKVSSTDKRYIERLAMVGGSLSFDGVPIIPTTLVTQDTYLIGDFSKNLLLDREDVSIEIGLDGNDWTKNMRTILAEWRGVNVLKNNDTTAFVTGTISTDAAALETP